MFEQLAPCSARRLLWRACVIAGAALWWLLAGSSAGYAEDITLPGAALTSAVVTPDSPADETTATVIQPIVQPIVQPVVKTVQPVVEPVVKTVQPVVEPMVKTVQPVVEPMVKTVQPVVEPVVKTVQPVVEPVVKTVQPVVRTVQPVVERVLTVGVELVTRIGDRFEDAHAAIDEDLAAASAGLQTSSLPTAQAVQSPVAALAEGTPLPVSAALGIERRDPSATDQASLLRDQRSRSAALSNSAPHSVELELAVTTIMAEPTGTITGLLPSMPAVPLQQCSCATAYSAGNNLATAGDQPAPQGGVAASMSRYSITAPLTQATLSTPNAERAPADRAEVPPHTPC